MGDSVSNLTVPTEGICAGHKCDACSMCRKGACCRRDRPDYRLPEVGTWPEPMFGELGRLERPDDEHVICHICGGAYKHMGLHANQSHGVWADEYRAYFGLNRLQGLTGRAWARTHSAAASEPERLAFLETVRVIPTPEQHSATMTGMKERAQSIESKRQARTLPDRPCTVCGEPVTRRNALTILTGLSHGVRPKTCSAECQKRAAHPLAGDLPCTVCGKPVTRRKVSRGRPKTCGGDECKRAAIARGQKARAQERRQRNRVT